MCSAWSHYLHTSSLGLLCSKSLVREFLRLDTVPSDTYYFLDLSTIRQNSHVSATIYRLYNDRIAIEAPAPIVLREYAPELKVILSDGYTRFLIQVAIHDLTIPCCTSQHFG